MATGRVRNPWLSLSVAAAAITAGTILAEAAYLLARNVGLVIASEPCGSYANPYSCVEFDIRIQLSFLVAGGATGFFLFFINAIHQRMRARRMGLGLTIEFAVFIGISFLIRDDTFFMAGLLTGYLALVVAILSGLDRVIHSPARQTQPITTASK